MFEQAAQEFRRTAGSRRRGDGVRRTSLETHDDVVVEVDGDDHVGAQRATGRNGHRIDQTAIDQPAAVDHDGVEDAGNRNRSAHRPIDRPLPQPDLAARLQIGGDDGEGRGALLYRPVDAQFAQQRHDPSPVDQPAAREANVEQPRNVAPAETLHPFLQRLEAAAHEGGADQRADRGAADDVGLDARLAQRLDDADMGPAARRAAAQRQPDARTAGTACAHATCA